MNLIGLDGPRGVAVNAGGGVYVADPRHDRIVTLGAGSTTQTDRRFRDLRGVGCIAVDAVGNVYAADEFGNRILKLPAAQ